VSHASPQPKRHLGRFSCFCTARGRELLSFIIARPLSAQSCPFGLFFTQGIWTQSNTQLLWLTRLHIPKDISICSAVFAGLTVVTDHLSVTNGQSNLTTGRITVTHGHLNGIHQVVPVCTPPNMCLLWPTRVLNPTASLSVQPFLGDHL